MRWFGRQRWPLIMLLCGTGLLVLLLSSAMNRSSPPPPLPPSQVRLAVLVVFDQLRGDYLERWHDLFGADGFHRLEREGTWFQNCHYPYSLTVTGAGHASILTGCSPDRHGIVSNEWLQDGRTVNCVGSDRDYQIVPRASKARATAPDRLLAPTVGEALKEATGGRARLVGLSIKDRSAMLPVGRRADAACYWFDAGTGLFVTSTYYNRDQPHSWVAEFNRDKVADRWRDRTWDRFGSFDYAARSGPDDAPGEGKGVIVLDGKGGTLVEQGITFPHPMPAERYYDALDTSPFGNELLLELARRAIDGEQLGQRDVPDLLTISFSSNDIIGHVWGPDSQEVLDVTLRSDLIVRDLLAHLDARVGRGNYILAVTADHGVCRMPEVSRRHGDDAQRISAGDLIKQSARFLDQHFGASAGGAWFAPTDRPGRFFPWMYLNRVWLRERNLSTDQVAEALVSWLKQQPGILTAYGSSQLAGEVPADDAIGQRVRHSYYPGRSGDVVVIQKPLYLFAEDVFGATGTTHGSPHPYDTHVPLLVLGPGIPGGPQTEPVTPQATAVILARALGIPPPARAEAPLPGCLVGN